MCIISLALLTHGRGGEGKRRGRKEEGKERRERRGKDWGDGRENISSYATLLTYSSRLVDSDSLYGGWYWPQAEALAVHVVNRTVRSVRSSTSNHAYFEYRKFTHAQ